MDSTDKDHMMRTNQYYIAQLSSMEIKISELKAQLHAKDFEIDYLNSKVSPSKAAHDKGLEAHELKLQLSAALKENELLKKQIDETEDISIIKSQLEHAVHMKDLFEQKYRELNLQVKVSEKSLSLESDKDQTIQRLKKEIEFEKSLKNQFKEKHDYLANENANLKQELINKNKQVQDFKRKLFKSCQIENENKVLNSFSVITPNLLLRTNSNSRKNSPDVKNSKELTLKKNIQYQQSPKLNLTTEIRKPKIVSISLESSLLRQDLN
ncbi:hypothetical protein SteCoe_2453 [Stentor coeruleus]|uniref:Uncharacterized protein n=1 Tax=Stentor coeruleus TaxID=5963 RepID=A0A1R2CZK3_9CILI|nr:hypothetical protein SteCoe_2453 [Stentor coeruleus]